MLPITFTTRACRALTASSVVIGLVAAPHLIHPAPARAVVPGYSGKIVFSSSRDGNQEIYVMNADGSNQTNLTNDPAADIAPEWSSDGTKIAFHSDRDGNQEIYVMNADGSGLTRLTTVSGNDNFPTWSPDGTKIAFTSNRDGNSEIYVMNADGSDQTRLTNNTDLDISPSWSPDGTKIVWRQTQAGNSEVYVMDADGSNQVNLTNEPASDSDPVWSPDGTKIAFQSSRDGGASEVYLMDADGSNPVRVTVNADADDRPSFSPDGTQLAFDTNRDGDSEIYLMDADGSNQVNLTNDPGYDARPDWQPMPNQAPVATGDTPTISYNTAGEKAVLANDTDEEALKGTNLSITVDPSHGSAEVDAATGTIQYTPTTGYTGADQLTYRICDNFLLDQQCSTAVLGITVQAGPVPAKPTIISVGTVTMNGASTVYYTGHRPTFSGTAEAGAAIRVEINSDPIVLMTTADSTGAWSVTPDQDIPDGEHTVTIAATKDGSTSEPLTFVLGINVFIPATGADPTALRLLGVALLAGGVGTGLLRRRRVPLHRVPSLFP